MKLLQTCICSQYCGQHLAQWRWSSRQVHLAPEFPWVTGGLFDHSFIQQTFIIWPWTVLGAGYTMVRQTYIRFCYHETFSPVKKTSVQWIIILLNDQLKRRDLLRKRKTNKQTKKQNEILWSYETMIIKENRSWHWAKPSLRKWFELSLKVKHIHCADHKPGPVLNNESAVDKKTGMALTLAKLMFSNRERTINTDT